MRAVAYSRRRARKIPWHEVWVQRLRSVLRNHRVHGVEQNSDWRSGSGQSVGQGVGIAGDVHGRRVAWTASGWQQNGQQGVLRDLPACPDHHQHAIPGQGAYSAVDDHITPLTGI